MIMLLLLSLGQGFLGLSGAILIQVYLTLFNGKPSTFLLILALLPTVVSLLLMCLVKVHGSNTGDEKKHLNGFSSVALTIAGYLMILIILGNIFTLPLWVRILTFLVLLLLLSSPLKIAIEAQREEMRRSSQATSSVRTPLVEHPESAKSQKFPTTVDRAAYNEEMPIGASQEKGSSEYQENVTSANNTLQTGDETNLLQAVCTINFWLLFAAMICGMGSGLATINNISQIGESLNYTTVEINALVSLWSIWNFLGRFGAGYVSDFILHRRGWGRPLVMALTQATMTAGHVIIASGFAGNLYVGSIIIGVCYGSQWSLMPTITSDIFGVRHMGTIFNTIAAANPVGSYFFSVKVIGYFYDTEAALHDGNSCYGTHCFMLSFFIFASVSFLGFLISLSLCYRTRKFYSQVLVRRLKHSCGQ